jgi:hypothetical protein
MLSPQLTPTFVFVFVSVMAILARAGIIARGGDHCDGGEGANVSCDGHPVIEKRQCQSTLTTALVRMLQIGNFWRSSP